MSRHGEKAISSQAPASPTRDREACQLADTCGCRTGSDVDNREVAAHRVDAMRLCK